MPFAHLFGQSATVDSLPVKTAQFDTVNTRTDTFNRATTDTTKVDSAMAEKKLKRHSPLKAAIFSAILPGLGQAYNKHYWKIPVIYVGFGGLGYALYYTSSTFNGYRNAYRYNLAYPNATVPASYNGSSDVAALKDQRDTFKKNVDITSICTAVWFILNVVDAAVDAHLIDWNVKNDLTIAWHPVLIPPSYGAGMGAVGINLAFNF